jgi:hypothetical protein
MSLLKYFTGEEFIYQNATGSTWGIGGEVEGRIIFGHYTNLFLALSYQHLRFDLTSSENYDVPLNAQSVLLPNFKAVLGMQQKIWKNFWGSLTLLYGSARSQAELFTEESKVKEYRPAPQYVLLNAALMANDIFKLFSLKLFLVNAISNNYQDYYLGLPDHLPRGGREIYLETSFVFP